MTSMVAAIIGFGGGMLLIAILPVFLSPALVIPIHGLVQLASNSSRMLFSLKHVRWQLLPRFSASVSRYESYYLIGFLQTGLGLVVGATGPLSLSVLTKQLKSKDEIIATSSLFMTISHLAKVPVYLSFTESIFSDLGLIVYMVLGAILGSLIGTKLRLGTKNGYIIKIIKVLLTLLAVKMIGEVAL
nr:TSUP family transporter [uncultured Vibrio sp.]